MKVCHLVARVAALQMGCESSAAISTPLVWEYGLQGLGKDLDLHITDERAWCYKHARNENTTGGRARCLIGSAS
jgi:hypothetical protein